MLNIGGKSRLFLGYVAAASVPAATAVTFTGPSVCNAGVSSTNFTISVDHANITGTLVVTPASNHSGTFSPTTVSLTTASPFAYVTFLPDESGIHTLSCTNDGGLTNPATLPFGVVAVALVMLVAGPTDSTPWTNLASLHWAWWDITDPDLMDSTAAVDAGAAGTTDAFGYFREALPHTVKTGIASGIGTLMIWNTADAPTKVAVGVVAVL